MQFKEQRESRLKKIEDHLRETSYTFKLMNVYVMEMLGGEEEKKAEILLEEIMAENFPIAGKH